MFQLAQFVNIPNNCMFKEVRLVLLSVVLRGSERDACLTTFVNFYPSSRASSKLCPYRTEAQFQERKQIMLALIQSKSRRTSVTLSTKTMLHVLKELSKLTLSGTKIEFYKAIKVVPERLLTEIFPVVGATNSEHMATHRIPTELSGDFSAAAIDMHTLLIPLKNL